MRVKTKLSKAVVRREIITQMINNNVEITADDISKALGVSISTIERDLSNLRKQGKVKYVGSAKTGRWIVLNRK